MSVRHVDRVAVRVAVGHAVDGGLRVHDLNRPAIRRRRDRRSVGPGFGGRAVNDMGTVRGVRHGWSDLGVESGEEA